jgi:hypothetical protein
MPQLLAAIAERIDQQREAGESWRRRKGWPDICHIKNGKFYGIEVKSEIGRLSQEQEGRDIILNGGVYVVARSIDDVQAAGL